MGMCYIPVEVIDAVYLDRTRPAQEAARLSVPAKCWPLYEAADKTGGAATASRSPSTFGVALATADEVIE